MAIFDRGKLVITAGDYTAVQKLNKKVEQIRALTQAEYDAMPSKDRNTLYLIVGA